MARVSPLVMLLMIGAAGCGDTRLPVRWTVSDVGIIMEARGEPGAEVIVLAGQPTGPHFRPDAPRFWSTVGPPLPDGSGGAALGRAVFDSSGDARIETPAGALPRTPFVVQAIALSSTPPQMPLGVSACMAVAWKGGKPELTSHATSVLRSPAGARILAAVALVLAGVFARRLVVSAAPRRRVILGLLVVLGLILLCARVFAPDALAASRRAVPAPLLATPQGPPFDASELAPLLLLLALPAGLVLTRGMLPHGSRVARLGTATLAGIGAITGIAQALAVLGLPARWSMPALAAAGCAVWFFLHRAGRSDRTADAHVRSDVIPSTDGIPAVSRAHAREGRTGGPRSIATNPSGGGVGPRAARHSLFEACSLALVGILLFVPFLEARAFDVNEHDALFIWAPRAAFALDEAPARIDPDMPVAHPEYPRGLGMITGAIAWAAGGLDGNHPRVVPLALFFLALLAVFDALASRGNRMGAAIAVVILGAVPLLVHHASSGYADVAMGGFVLLGALGLTSGSGGTRACGLAVAGVAGAVAMKDEGLAFAIVMLPFLGWRARLCVVAISAPWAIVRFSAAVGGPVSWRSVPQNAGLLMTRFDQILRELAHFMLGMPDPSPGSLELPDAIPGGDLVSHVILVVALVLAIGRGGSIRVLPIVLLFGVELLAILVSPQAVAWHLVTAWNRLLLQALPLFVVAAVGKLSTPRADYPARTRT